MIQFAALRHNEIVTRTNPTDDEARIKTLLKSLFDELDPQLRPSSVLNRQKSVQEEKISRLKKKAKKKCVDQETLEDDPDFRILMASIAEINKTLSETAKDVNVTPKELEIFLNSFIRAIRIADHPNSLYPPHTIERVLSAFVIAKNSEITAVKSMLEGMPKITTKEANKNAINTEKKILNDYKNDDNTSHFPPVISYGTVFNSDLKETYPDCGETALRNFFNAIAFDRRNDGSQFFNFEKIRALNGRKFGDRVVKIDRIDAIAEFYKKFDNPTKMASQEARAYWLPIVSDLKNAIYLKPENSYIKRGELSGGVNGFINALNALFGIEICANHKLLNASSRNMECGQFLEPDFAPIRILYDSKNSGIDYGKIELFRRPRADEHLKHMSYLGNLLEDREQVFQISMVPGHFYSFNRKHNFGSTLLDPNNPKKIDDYTLKEAFERLNFLWIEDLNVFSDSSQHNELYFQQTSFLSKLIYNNGHISLRSAHWVAKMLIKDRKKSLEEKRLLYNKIFNQFPGKSSTCLEQVNLIDLFKSSFSESELTELIKISSCHRLRN